MLDRGDGLRRESSHKVTNLLVLLVKAYLMGYRMFLVTLHLSVAFVCNHIDILLAVPV